MNRLPSSTLLLSLLLITYPIEAQTQLPKTACINSTTGVIALRYRCRSATEKALSRSSYADPDNDLSTRITNNSSSIDLLKGTSDGHTADITALESAMNSNTDSIGDNTSNISSLTATTASHTTTLARHTSDINSLTTTTASHSTTLAGHTTSITALNSSVGDHTTTLASHGTDIAASAASITKLQPVSVYVVASSGSPYSTLAAALTAAINAGASASSPALVKIAPGEYDLPSSITVLPGITVQGSGIDRTFLQGTGSLLLQMTTDTALSDLTVRKTSGSTGRLLFIIAASRVTIQRVKFRDSALLADRVISIRDSADIIFKDVTVDYSGGGDGAFGIDSENSAPSFYRLNAYCSGSQGCRTFFAQGTGLVSIHDSYLESSDTIFGATTIQMADATRLLLMNSRLKSTSDGTFGPAVLDLGSSGGVQIVGSIAECSGTATAAPCVLSAGGGLVEILNSRISTDDADEDTVVANFSTTVRIFSTLLDKGNTRAVGGATITCAGVTDESFSFMASTCP